MTSAPDAAVQRSWSPRRLLGLLVLPAIFMLLMLAMTHIHRQAASLPEDAIWPLTDALVQCHREALRQAGQPGAEEMSWNTLRQHFVIRGVTARSSKTGLRLRVRIASRPGLAAYPPQRLYFDAEAREDGDWSVQASPSVLRYWIP